MFHSKFYLQKIILVSHLKNINNSCELWPILESFALASLHFALRVVQQIRANLSLGQMLYLTQSWHNPLTTKSD